MPRPLRPCIAGGVYHAYARSIRDTVLFVDDDDRAIFLSLLGLVAVRCEWDVLAYCLMGNHYHVVIRTPNADISEGMQLLNGRYAMLVNARYGYRGHVFGGRFKCRVIGDDDDLEGVLTYVEHNPVRHGMCRVATQWPWSSARRRASLATPAKVVDLVAVMALHAGSLDETSERFKRIVRSRWAGSPRPHGP
jgi:REP element-mobilizing transposase RayT